jgi:Ser-tRNA(Ala) deacylase AlaX
LTEAAYLYPIEAAYERSFRASVVSRPPGAVVLDRTLFYPTGGGQPCDQGRLVTAAGVRFPVTDVRKSGSAIVHLLGRPQPTGSPPLSEGEPVLGEIDWERRFRHMRLHTSQHLVSALLFARTGRRTTAATMSGDRAVIDLEGPWPAPLDWPELERAVRSELGHPRPVRIEWVPRIEWDRHPSDRSGAVPLAPHVDPVRVLEIEGVDRCPCGGTHLRSTGEIGGLELVPPDPHAAGARVMLRLRGISAHSERVTP